MEIIERLLGLYFVSLIKEGKRFLRFKTLSISLELMNKTRLAVLYLFIVTLSCFSAFMGLFIIVIHLSYQNVLKNSYEFGLFFWLGTGLTIAGVAMASWAIRERQWIRFLKLQEYCRVAIQEENRSVGTMDPLMKDQILISIQSLIDERIRNVLDEALKNQKIP